MHFLSFPSSRLPDTLLTALDQHRLVPCCRSAFSLVIVGFCLILAACGSDSGEASGTISNSSPGGNSNSVENRLGYVAVSPVNIMSDYVQRVSPPALVSADANKLLNGGFENGTADWTGCGAGTISEFLAPYDGEKALRLSRGNCFYQVVAATPGEDVVLSCYARVLSDLVWTGMGLGFSDADWNLISETPATLITDYSFNRYDVRTTVPPGAASMTMWFYSETDAIVDNCTLLPAELAPQPPLNSEINLLENADFDTTNSGLPDQWLKFCGGSLAANIDGGDIYIEISDGACISQSLSASDIAAMQGNTYEYSCDIDLYADSYVSIVLNLDGDEHTAVVPPNSSSNVAVVVDAPASIASGYVGIYSEAPQNGMRVYNCELTPVDDMEDAIDPAGNLLFNGSFDERDSNNKPQGWTLGCDGTWNGIESPLSAAALELSADNGFACAQQTLNQDEVAALSENTYTLSCDAWNYEQGWALLQIESGGVEKRHYISNTADYQPVTFTGELSYITDATFGIYASRGLRVDNCSLVAGTHATGGNVASIDVRANIEGPDHYAVEGPLDYDVVVTNNGALALNAIAFRDPVDSCTGSIDSLQPGESVTQGCQAIRQNDQNNTIEITASATVSDGSEVSDTDTIGFGMSFRPNPGMILSIRSNQRTVSAGEDVTLTVSVATTGNVSGVANVSSFQVAPMNSYQDECDKVYDTPLIPGQYDVYECVLGNVTEDQTINVEVISGNPPYRAVIRDAASVSVQ